MPDISTRINALIAYLFLGPLLLLAKSGTPLADPYVRGHAKKASIIILIGILIFFIYRFLKEFLMFSMFGFSIDIILLTMIVSCTLAALIIWAYRAYNGVPANESTWKSFSMPENTMQVWTYSEEDKIRIIASFIPFIGIIVANKYPMWEVRIGRKIGSLFIFILLTSILFFSGATTTLTLICTLIFIGTIVTTAVYLFGFSRFLNFTFYNQIPTYPELDAHIKAGIMWLFDFFRIAFGWEHTINYRAQYTRFLENNQVTQSATISYFAPNWIIAIPVLNLLTIPSLWQSKYKEYAPLILQGLCITLITGIIVLYYGIGSQMELYLIFPIIALIVEGKNNLLVRAPFTSIMIDLYILFSRGQSRIAEIKENGEEKVSYTYEVEDK
jgi:hypothetical protein